MDIQKLIEQAEELKNKKETRTKITLEIPRFKELGFEDFTVVLQKPTTTIMLSAQEHDDKYYQLCECMVNPNLSDVEVQKAFKVNNKTALLKKIFTEEEIEDMIMHLGRLTLTQTKAKSVADIKNL